MPFLLEDDVSKRRHHGILGRENRLSRQDRYREALVLGEAEKNPGQSTEMVSGQPDDIVEDRPGPPPKMQQSRRGEVNAAVNEGGCVAASRTQGT